MSFAVNKHTWCIECVYYKITEYNLLVSDRSYRVVVLLNISTAYGPSQYSSLINSEMCVVTEILRSVQSWISKSKIFSGDRYREWKLRLKSLLSDMQGLDVIESEVPGTLDEAWEKQNEVAHHVYIVVS